MPSPDFAFHITLPVAASITIPVYFAIAGLANDGARIFGHAGRGRRLAGAAPAAA